VRGQLSQTLSEHASPERDAALQAMISQRVIEQLVVRRAHNLEVASAGAGSGEDTSQGHDLRRTSQGLSLGSGVNAEDDRVASASGDEPPPPRWKIAMFAGVPARLGLKLRKGPYGEAIVDSVESACAAKAAGVHAGDTILGVNSCRTSEYTKVLWLLKHSERPLHLMLLPAGAGRKDSEGQARPAATGVAEPLQLTLDGLEVVFTKRELGLRLVQARDDGLSVVFRVNKGGAAEELGVKVGMRVAMVRGALVSSHHETVTLLRDLSRPTTVLLLPGKLAGTASY